MKKILGYLLKLMQDKNGKLGRKMHFAVASFILSIIVTFTIKDIYFTWTYLASFRNKKVE